MNTGYSLDGLIPARAGKTNTLEHWVLPGWAHPRACGENDVYWTHALYRLGSSPRVRGKRPVARHGLSPVGLIPARAGKTSAVRLRDLGPEAHPRACGENQQGLQGALHRAGSSPRVRGKPGDPPGQAARRRLIPARAGKTCSGGGPCSTTRAHPRACGENTGGAGTVRAPRGSSPRVRGKPHPPARGRAPARLIPARAGKTSGVPETWCSSTAHPRACGENQDENIVNLSKDGSSPRVRGKLARDQRQGRGDRLIPARAGKTANAVWAAPMMAAHPRACGENVAWTPLQMASQGSSPRVRGKRLSHLP